MPRDGGSRQSGDSPFHKTFGYYAHGVGPETATLPKAWRNRWVRFATPNTAGIVGHCLSPVDLAVSKLLAGREKDLAYVRGLIESRFVTPAEVAALEAELTPENAALLRARLASCHRN